MQIGELFVCRASESGELDAVTIKRDFQIVRHFQAPNNVYRFPV